MSTKPTTAELLSSLNGSMEVLNQNVERKNKAAKQNVTLAEKIILRQEEKAARLLLHDARLNFFGAEDAIDAWAKGDIHAFEPYRHLYPETAQLIPLPAAAVTVTTPDETMPSP
jgi:hypothetical protein